MRSKQFWPGDKVITIVDYGGVPSGTVGKVASRWVGTAYVVRLPDGTFRWLNSSAFSSTDPSHHNLKTGDIGVVTSIKNRYDFAKIGDLFQVYKVVEDVDYYGVIVDDVIHWFGGFQLASYAPFKPR